MSGPVKFPSTSGAAQERLTRFLQNGLSDYAVKRNYVSDSLREVSRLSPAVRHRIITEYELVERAIATEGLERCEQFCQEVYWRLFWKGFLEYRPGLWSDWLDSLNTFSDQQLEQASAIENGKSGVAIMDAFSRQLVETGYLHNHARMWFAAFWIHTLRLPWQAGARFFYTHLLDGDPASNTLSWRWVAGLHTRGKQYLVRQSNIEKYVDPDFYAANQKGIGRLADSRAEPAPIAFHELPDRISLPSFPEEIPVEIEETGVWLHEDDVSFEDSPLSGVKAKAVFISSSCRSLEELPLSRCRDHYLDQVFDDLASRVESFYRVPVTRESGPNFEDDLCKWIAENGIKALCYVEPFVGPAKDAIKSASPLLDGKGIIQFPLRRGKDQKVLPLAKSGFFGFWKKLKLHQ